VEGWGYVFVGSTIMQTSNHVLYGLTSTATHSSPSLTLGMVVLPCETMR